MPDTAFPVQFCTEIVSLEIDFAVSYHTAISQYPHHDTTTYRHISTARGYGVLSSQYLHANQDTTMDDST
eukprot:2704354-Rhodomonas_salina.1